MYFFFVRLLIVILVLKLTDVAFTKNYDKKTIFTQKLLVNFTNNYKDAVTC